MNAHSRIHVGQHDRLVLDGVDYRVLSSDGNGHVFEQARRSGLTIAMTHAQFAAAVQTNGYRYFPNYYSPSLAEAHLASGVHDIAYLPAEEQVRIRWRLEYALRFVRGERDRGFTRSDEGFDDAAKALEPEVQREQLVKRLNAPMRVRVDATPPAAPKGPSGRTLRRDVEKLERHDWNPVVLRRNTRRSGNETVKVDVRVADFLLTGVLAFKSRRQRTKAACLRLVRYLITRHNRHLLAEERKRLAALGPSAPALPRPLPLLKAPAQTTLDRRIARIPKFELVLAREGIEKAEATQRPLSSGLAILRPGQRLEIDHWSVPMKVILRKIGLDRILTKEEAKSLERVSVVACVVYDRASRCVLGLSLSASGNTASALCAMELAVSPKDRHAAAVGATSGWPMRCTPDAVVSDAGNEFVDIEFRTRVIDLLSSPRTAMAGKPNQRGGEERLFSTLEKGFVAEFRGRTFENPVRRGKYEPEEETSITVEDLLQGLLRYILDVYHNTAHAGLGGRTPAQEWHALVERYWLAPPPDRDLRRHVFGINMSRLVGPHGVTVLGLQYTSLALQEHFRQRGPCEADVRADPLDLGALSLRVPGTDDWIVLGCRTGGFDQVSMVEWERAARRLQRDYGREAVLTQRVVDEALEEVRAISDRRVYALGLGNDRPTDEFVRAVERDLTNGFTMPSGDAVRPVPVNLLTGGIPRGGRGLLPARQADATTAANGPQPARVEVLALPAPSEPRAAEDAAAAPPAVVPTPAAPAAAAKPAGGTTRRRMVVESMDDPEDDGRRIGGHDD